MSKPFSYRVALRGSPRPGFRPQHGRCLAAAGRAGGAAHAAARRQRRRRGARDGDHADRGRADRQRHRQRRLRHRLGRQAARPERVGPLAGGLDAGALRRPRRHAAAQGWDSVTVPGAVSAWVEPVASASASCPSRAVRAGDRLCARRLPGLAGDRRSSGRPAPSATGRPAGLRRAFLPTAARPRPASVFRCPAMPRTLETDRRDARREPSTAASSAERIAAHRAASRRRRSTTEDLAAHRERLGRHRSRTGFRGARAARDSAERPGHRRADGAGHPASTSASTTWLDEPGDACTCRSRR